MLRHNRDVHGALWRHAPAGPAHPTNARAGILLGRIAENRRLRRGWDRRYESRLFADGPDDCGFRSLLRHPGLRLHAAGLPREHRAFDRCGEEPDVTAPRRSLILAGGGMRVAYQAGVIKALAEA